MKKTLTTSLVLWFCIITSSLAENKPAQSSYRADSGTWAVTDALAKEFITPPQAAKPGVYWFFYGR
jgi:hypothetical protein